MKKYLFSVVSITALWFVMDYVIHGLILTGLYQETASVWRPIQEMSHLQGLFISMAHAVLFVTFYQYLAKSKHIVQGSKFGCFVGLMIGLAMANFYLYLPIPIYLALGWFLGTLVEYVAAGSLVAYFTKSEGNS